MKSTAITGLLVLLAACAPDSPATPGSVPATATVSATTSTLPDDEAGRIVARAIAAAGGLERWRQHRDVSFISTLTLFDQQGSATSETIFLHKLQLQGGLRARLESIGLLEELLFGFDGSSDWMLREGKAMSDVASTAFTRFHALSSTFWFGLPFVLADSGRQLSYLGLEERGDKSWHKVRVDRAGATPLPCEWVVIYFDAETGLIDRVHAEVEADFLAYRVWLGRWGDYREVDGIQRERRRLFYPADPNGDVLGSLAAEQLVEHVRFDNGWPPEMFQRPLIAGGGAPAG